MNNIVKVPSVGVAGFITCEAVKDGEVVRSLPQFQNLILDQGLDLMAGPTNKYLGFCQAGTGNTAPTVADIALDTRVAGKGCDSTVTASLNTTDKYLYSRLTYTFATGAATGNIAEIGIGSATSGNTLFSRSLVKDGLGDPTTITILADEKLRVTYEFRVYQPQSDIFDATVDGYAIVGRSARSSTTHHSTGWYMMHLEGGLTSSASDRNVFLADRSTSSGWCTLTTGNISAAITGMIDGTTLKNTYNSSYASDGAYTPGNFYRDITFNFSTAEVNHGSGIGAIALAVGPTYFQFGFTPNIMKTSLDSLALVFRYSWARKTL